MHAYARPHAAGTLAGQQCTRRTLEPGALAHTAHPSDASCGKIRPNTSRRRCGVPPSGAEVVLLQSGQVGTAWRTAPQRPITQIDIGA